MPQDKMDSGIDRSAATRRQFLRLGAFGAGACVIGGLGNDANGAECPAESPGWASTQNDDSPWRGFCNAYAYWEESLNHALRTMEPTSMDAMSWMAGLGAWEVFSERHALVSEQQRELVRQAVAYRNLLGYASYVPDYHPDSWVPMEWQIRKAARGTPPSDELLPGLTAWTVAFGRLGMFVRWYPRSRDLLHELRQAGDGWNDHRLAAVQVLQRRRTICLEVTYRDGEDVDEVCGQDPCTETVRRWPLSSLRDSRDRPVFNLARIASTNALKFVKRFGPRGWPATQAAIARSTTAT